MEFVNQATHAIRAWLVRYGFVVLAVGAATALRYWLGKSLGLSAPYITFFPAVTLVALVGGLGPGLVATVLSGVAADYLFLEPHGFGFARLGDRMGFALFMVNGVAAGMLGGTIRRRNAELRRSKSDLDRAQAVAEVGSWHLDVAKNTLTWSKETYRLFDIPIGTPVSRGTVLERVLPEDHQELMDGWDAALEGAASDVEHRLVVGGETRWVRSRAQVELDSGGKPRFATGTFQDITERKRAEEKLRAAALNARNLLEASLDPLVTISREGKITDVNEATERVTGVARERLIGSDFSDHFTEPEKARHGYEQAFAQGSVRDYPLVVRHVSGKLTDVLYNATVFRNEKGEIEGVFAAARDITERKRAERALRSLSACNESLMRATDEQGLLQRICDLVVKVGGYRMAWVGYADHDARKTVRVVAASGFETGHLDTVNVTWADEERGRGPTGTAIRTGEATVCRDVTSDPRFAPWRENAIRRGYRSVQVFPLKNGEEVLGAISIYATEAGAFDAAEHHLLKELSDNLNYGIMALRAGAERRQAEEQVRNAALHARSLIEASLDPLVTISREGKITDVNRATEEVTGVSRERLIGSDFSDYFTEPEKARQGYERGFTEETVRDYPLAIRHTSGGVTDVLYNASVFKNEAGEIEGVFAAARDVTERKRTEEIKLARLRLAEFALTHSLDEQLQATLDEVERLTGSAIGFFHFLEADQKTLSLQSWSTRTITEHCTAEGKGRHYDIEEAGVWVDCIRERRPVIHNDCASVPPRKGLPEGHAQVIRELVVPILRGDRIVAILGVGNKPQTYNDQDIQTVTLLADLAWEITERKRAEEEVHRLNEELEKRVIQRTAQLEAVNHELEAFSYSVSHDLRAPLRHIAGFSKLLMEEFGPTLDPNAKRYLDRVHAGTQEMGVLVDGLLNLTRVGRHALTLHPAKLNAIVAEVIAILQPESEGRQVEWVMADLPTVECDPVLVKQIFQNLLSNALKFTRPRAHAVIEVSHKEEDGQAVFMVRDNGIGFNMKYVDKLFGVFQRLHRAEDFEGTGIGLATVQRIVQKHRGRVWAEGKMDQGAAFYFTLRVGKQAEPKRNGAAAGGQS